MSRRFDSIEETHDSSLQKVLGIVDIAKDVLRGMVAKSSVRDGVDDRAHLVPRVLLCWHRKTMTMGKEDKRREESGGRFDRREEITTHVTTFPGRATLHANTK